MLTRITDRKIPCVYIHVYQITKNWGPEDIFRVSLSDANQREVHMFYLAREVEQFGHVLAEITL